MNKWQETVKRVAKQHAGKSLREILPIAKKEYKKVGHHVAKKSRKARKGRKGRRSMKGGSASVGTNSMDGGVQPFDGEWNGEQVTVGGGDGVLRGGSKRRGSKRRGSKRGGSKRRGRGSKRRGSKRR